MREAAQRDPDIICERDKLDTTFGSNPAYLKDILGIDKSDLLKLERLGLALKTRYETKEGHRTRWLIFSEVLQ